MTSNHEHTPFTPLELELQRRDAISTARVGWNAIEGRERIAESVEGTRVGKAHRNIAEMARALRLLFYNDQPR
jgi:hypothetical protein